LLTGGGVTVRTPGRFLEGPSEHCEHPLGENDGAQGDKCKWQSVEKQGWKRQRERRRHFKGCSEERFSRQRRIQRDGNKCQKEGPERNSALGRKVGSRGASEGGVYRSKYFIRLTYVGIYWLFETRFMGHFQDFHILAE